MFSWNTLFFTDKHSKGQAKKQHVRKQRLRSNHPLCRRPVSPLDDDGLVYRRLVVVIVVVALRFSRIWNCLLFVFATPTDNSGFLLLKKYIYERSNQNDSRWWVGNWRVSQVSLKWTLSLPVGQYYVGMLKRSLGCGHSCWKNAYRKTLSGFTLETSVVVVVVLEVFWDRRISVFFRLSGMDVHERAWSSRNIWNKKHLVSCGWWWLRLCVFVPRWLTMVPATAQKMAIAMVPDDDGSRDSQSGRRCLLWRRLRWSWSIPLMVLAMTTAPLAYDDSTNSLKHQTHQ